MPITWDDRSDAKLLAGVLSQTSSELDLNALAKYMGDGCTVNALRHRIARIKKKVANDENLINTGQSSSGAHGTGVAKRKRGCAPKVAPTKLKQAISSDEDDKEDLVFKDESEAEEGDKGKKAKVDIDDFEDDDKLFKI